ncbi:hypothetical protein [Winogradskya humida]|uniref:Lipoprotein n=1 Tax=Winogradskya humida TaxID=113566 RepID=A0ABQ4A5C9_9ACTN|nr:hypothetical protein [Actinoplanes humidus]GIE25552.1 hypothetical protein Ahu01nite_086540 [Actinoplanes humidus]
MHRTRVLTLALAVTSALALAACGDKDATTAAPAASTPASTAAASTVASDKHLCASVQKIGDDLKDDLVKMSNDSADPKPGTFTTILNGLSDKVTAEAFSAGDSAVALAARQLAAEAANAAKDPDPVAAAGSAGFEKAGNDLTAACKTVGVTVYF